MCSITKKLYFHSSVKKVWAALADQKAIRDWLGGSNAVTLELVVGGHFSYFGGEITGVFTKIEEPIILEYTWRRDDWPANWPDSVVRFEIKGYGLDTQIKLTHGNFQNEEERDRQNESWEIDFFEPMREWAETTTNVVFGVAPFRRRQDAETKPGPDKVK